MTICGLAMYVCVILHYYYPRQMIDGKSGKKVKTSQSGRCDMGVENDRENGGYDERRCERQRQKRHGGHLEQFGADNLEGVDNLCAQLSGGGGL